MVSVKVKLSGWLASYFAAQEIQVETYQSLDKALPDVVTKVMAQALKPIPHGGLMITVNGQNVKKLDPSRFLLNEADTVTLIPVVAGG